MDPTRGMLSQADYSRITSQLNLFEGLYSVEPSEQLKDNIENLKKEAKKYGIKPEEWR